MSQLALPIDVEESPRAATKFLAPSGELITVREAKRDGSADTFSAAEWTCLAGDACQGFIPVDDHQTIFCPFHAPPEYRPVRIVQRRKGKGRVVTHVRDGDEWVAVPDEFEDIPSEFDDEDDDY